MSRRTGVYVFSEGNPSWKSIHCVKQREIYVFVHHWQVNLKRNWEMDRRWRVSFRKQRTSGVWVGKKLLMLFEERVVQLGPERCASTRLCTSILSACCRWIHSIVKVDVVYMLLFWHICWALYNLPPAVLGVHRVRTSACWLLAYTTSSQRYAPQHNLPGAISINAQCSLHYMYALLRKCSQITAFLLIWIHGADQPLAWP